jgi:hypothetical protein
MVPVLASAVQYLSCQRTFKPLTPLLQDPVTINWQRQLNVEETTFRRRCFLEQLDISSSPLLASHHGIQQAVIAGDHYGPCLTLCDQHGVDLPWPLGVLEILGTRGLSARRGSTQGTHQIVQYVELRPSFPSTPVLTYARAKPFFTSSLPDIIHQCSLLEQLLELCVY